MRVGTLAAVVREEGVNGLAERGWSRVLRHSPVTALLSDWVGPVRVAQLDCMPTLGYWPHIRHPRTFNEKVLHRMHCTDESVFTRLADKHAVRAFVRERVGSEVLTDLYHVTDDPATIPFDELPRRFVLKSTHGSGHVAIVDKLGDYDPDELVAECEEWLDESYGSVLGEYWYERIDPRIIATEYIDAPGRLAPRDYKCYVFDGEVAVIHVDHDRFADSEHTLRFYSRDWQPLDVAHGYPVAPIIDSPPDLDRLVELAEALGNGFDFARIDLYNPRPGVVRFGEVTLAPSAGQVWFDPVGADRVLGEQWNIHSPRVKAIEPAD